MIQKPLLKKKLKEISSILENGYSDENNLGVVAGISGIALFQFYYSKYLDVDEHADVGVEMISHCIEKINEGYSLPTFCSGIAGFGWAVQHLQAQNFIDLDCDELLSSFDEYLYNQMRLDLDKGNYDFLHGALGYAMYFLSRYEHTENIHLKNRYQSYLSDLIATLEMLSISEGDALKWESILEIRKGNKGFNLSLSHGIASILNFSSRLHRFEEFKESTRKIIVGSANYILGFKDKNPDKLSLLPSWVEKDNPLEYNGRLAWCYGDLGIGLSLLHGAQSLDDSSIMNQAMEILSQTTKRKLPEETFVVDAGVCHGSYGNALIYQKIWKKNSDSSFQKTMDFWIADGIQKAEHKDGYAGYKQWNGINENWEPQLSLLEGIAGIGLVIIDYLSEESNSWDECLLIS